MGNYVTPTWVGRRQRQDYNNLHQRGGLFLLLLVERGFMSLAVNPFARIRRHFEREIAPRVNPMVQAV